MVNAYFNQYNPSAWGWSADGSQVVPFLYRGQSFPSGVHRLTVALFTGVLDELVAAGLHVPTGPVMQAGNWGYEARTVRGSSDLSFHAYGLAIDVDAPHNGFTYSSPPPTTFPSKTHEIVAKWGCEWGGDWSGRKDPMHVECHLAPGAVAGVVAANGKSTSISTGNSTAHPVLHEGSTGAAVGTVQRRLNLKPALHPQFGPTTKEAVVMYQRRHKLAPDGVVGASTWSRLLTASILPGERYVAEGCTGPDVGWLQRRLGLTPSTHPAFGPKTGQALQAWKSKRGLGGGPSAGPVTWNALGANG